MKSLDWLVNRRLLSVRQQECQWVFRFEPEAHLTVECIWRLLDREKIRVTSQDDGHQFGLPATVSASDELTRTIVGSMITSVVLHDRTLDLELHFETSHVLQVLQTFTGYEAWNAANSSRLYVAGGGELTVFGDPGAGE